MWGVATPTTAFYRILPGKSADEGRQVLGGYRGTVVVDGYAVYEVLARDGPDFALAHCWAHTKRKFEANATDWPTACGEIDELIGDLYAVERLVPAGFPATPRRRPCGTSCVRSAHDRSSIGSRRGRPGKSACPERLGKAVPRTCRAWTGLTRFLDNPCIPLDNNAGGAGSAGPVVGRKNHYGSKSLRGTQVAALFYTLCETAKLGGIDPHAYLLVPWEAPWPSPAPHASRPRAVNAPRGIASGHTSAPTSRTGHGEDIRSIAGGANRDAIARRSRAGRAPAPPANSATSGDDDPKQLIPHPESRPAGRGFNA